MNNTFIQPHPAHTSTYRNHKMRRSILEWYRQLGLYTKFIHGNAISDFTADINIQIFNACACFFRTFCKNDLTVRPRTGRRQKLMSVHDPGHHTIHIYRLHDEYPLYADGTSYLTLVCIHRVRNTWFLCDVQVLCYTYSAYTSAQH